MDVTRDAYANQRLLLALGTVWIQHQPTPLKLSTSFAGARSNGRAT